ncbi:hypothetical protein IW261DRAFT_1425082 [Armillaria novae-zelandiae]|uniref:Uncharacterized protein n=1 Tax=Armillaria novae-zelandiae TaxID=153914 RepID=A0AA39NTE0_9AGAR|nr:hypothetical protein IW261DRAFT_1425082 [Armillaria novae-zelandiae]
MCMRLLIEKGDLVCNPRGITIGYTSMSGRVLAINKDKDIYMNREECAVDDKGINTTSFLIHLDIVIFIYTKEMRTSNGENSDKTRTLEKRRVVVVAVIEIEALLSLYESLFCQRNNFPRKQRRDNITINLLHEVVIKRETQREAGAGKKRITLYFELFDSGAYNDSATECLCVRAFPGRLEREAESVNRGRKGREGGHGDSRGIGNRDGSLSVDIVEGRRIHVGVEESSVGGGVLSSSLSMRNESWWTKANGSPDVLGMNETVEISSKGLGRRYVGDPGEAESEA